MHLANSASAWEWLASIHFHFHHFFHHLFHHRFHGPPFDYVGLAVGSFISSAGFPGPGEALLIAGGILAASGRLDITSLIAVAFVSGTAGGILGWLIGLKAGRTVLTAPGPLHRARVRALKRGDRIFHRQVAIAVILAPAWVAGVHHVRSRVYQPLNALAALVWALAVGLGAYFVGPPLADAFADLGLAALIGIGVVLIGGIVFEVFRRRRGERRRVAKGRAAGRSPEPNSQSSPRSEPNSQSSPRPDPSSQPSPRAGDVGTPSEPAERPTVR